MRSGGPQGCAHLIGCQADEREMIQGHLHRRRHQEYEPSTAEGVVGEADVAQSPERAVLLDARGKDALRG